MKLNSFSMLLISVILMSLMISCSTGPCSSKTYFLDSMEGFVEHVVEVENEITDEEWKIKDREFAVYTDECYPKYKGELSEEERDRYRLYTVKYKSLKASDGVSDFLKKGAKILSGVLGTELGDVDGELSDFIDQFKDGGEVNSALKQIKTELEDGGELRNALEDLKVKFEEEGEYEIMLEDLKEELNSKEFKKILEDLKVDLKEAGQDIKDVLEDSQD